MSLLDTIGDRLVAAGAAGGDSGWALYKAFLPDQPDRAVAVFEVAGPAPETRMAIDYPRFQVRIRGEPHGYAVARARADLAVAALHAGEAALGAGWVYLHVSQSGVLPVGHDDRRRPALVLNFHAMRSTA